MSSVRNPVGPQPASVYWRRRIFALLGLIAVIVVIILIVTSLQGGGGATPTPTPTGTTSAPPQGSGDEEDACKPAVILIEPIIDSASTHYAAGVLPQISMRITNTGSSACTLDVGTSQQYYAIVSGSDPIWNSRDCQTEPESFDLVLEPNDPVTTEPITWDRTRSSASTCSTARQAVAAGGSTYRLDVQLGDLTSAGDTAFILD